MVLHVHKNSCTVLVPLCKNNLNLPISDKDHYALRKYKQQLPQRFYFPTQQSRILTARVQHSILNLSHPYLKFQIHLIDLSQSSIQVLYGLQTDDGIRQCVNSMFNTKFVVRGQYIRFTTSLLISNYQKWQRCYVNKLRGVQVVSHHGDQSSCKLKQQNLYRKGVLAAKGFDINLVQFTCTISYVHGRAPKTVLRARNFVYEQI